MGIIQDSILSAIDIIVEKRIKDFEQSATKLLVAEIVDRNVITNKYRVKYQDMELLNVPTSEDAEYFAGDIVQVLRDSESALIIGLLSKGAAAKYQSYTSRAQATGIDTPEGEDNTDTSGALTLYSRSREGKFFSDSQISAFNEALKTATGVELASAIKIDNYNNKENNYKLIAQLRSVSIVVEDNKQNEVLSDEAITIELKFNAAQQSLQKRTGIIATSGTWVLSDVTFYYDSSATLINVELSTYDDKQAALNNRLTMTVQSPDSSFEWGETDNALTVKAIVTDNQSNTYSPSELRYFWGAKDLALTARDTTYYKAFLGEGWAPIPNDRPESNSISIGIEHVPGLSRDFKCVAVQPIDGKDTVVAEYEFQLFNSRNPQAGVSLQVTYAKDSDNKPISATVTAIADLEQTSVVNGEEVTDSEGITSYTTTETKHNYTYHWNKKNNKSVSSAVTDDLTTTEIDNIDITIINHHDVYFCSLYDKVVISTSEVKKSGDVIISDSTPEVKSTQTLYRGTDFVGVYSNTALESGDVGLTDENKRYALIRKIGSLSTSAKTYFKTITWWSSKEKAIANAYTGDSKYTATKDYSNEYYENGTEKGVYGYYLWEQRSYLTENGTFSTEYERLSPQMDWENSFKVTSYFLNTSTSSAPAAPSVSSETSDDGHLYLDTITYGDWKTTPPDLKTGQYQWKVLVTKYDDGKITVSVPAMISASGTLEGDVKILSITPQWKSGEKWEGYPPTTGSDTLASGSTYFFRCKLTYDNGMEGETYKFEVSGAGSAVDFTYAWSDNNTEEPFQYESDYGALDTENQNSYLWARIAPVGSIDNVLYQVVGVTLAAARIMSQDSKIEYAVGPKPNIPKDSTVANNAPITGWDTDFEEISKLLGQDDTKNSYVWSRVNEVYDTYYISELKGNDRKTTTPTAQEGTQAVLDWVAVMNETLIDGSRIATGSISADKILVSSLNAVAADIAGWTIEGDSLYSPERTAGSNNNHTLLTTYTREGSITQRIAVGGNISDDKSYAYTSTPYVVQNMLAYPKDETGVPEFTFSFIPQGISPSFEKEAKEIIIGTSSGEQSATGTVSTATKDNVRYEITVTLEGLQGIQTIVKCTINYSSNTVVALDNPVFQVLSDGSVYATQGEIAGFTMTTAPAGGELAKVLYNKKDGISVGLAAHDSEDSPAFWAGYKGSGDTPWDGTVNEGAWQDKTAFYVTNAGILNAKGAQISGDSSFSGSSFTVNAGADFGTGGLHIDSEGSLEGQFLANSTNQKWYVGIGKDFGITNDGTLYASNAQINGTITASSSSRIDLLAIGQSMGIGGKRMTGINITKQTAFGYWEDAGCCFGYFPDEMADSSSSLSCGIDLGMRSSITGKKVGVLITNWGIIYSYAETGAPVSLSWSQICKTCGVLA